MVTTVVTSWLIRQRVMADWLRQVETLRQKIPYTYTHAEASLVGALSGEGRYIM